MARDQHPHLRQVRAPRPIEIVQLLFHSPDLGFCRLDDPLRLGLCLAQDELRLPLGLLPNFAAKLLRGDERIVRSISSAT